MTRFLLALIFALAASWVWFGATWTWNRRPSPDQDMNPSEAIGE